MKTKFIKFTNHTFHRSAGFEPDEIVLLNINNIVRMSEVLARSKNGNESYLDIRTDEPMYENMDGDIVHPQYRALSGGITTGTIDELINT